MSNPSETNIDLDLHFLPAWAQQPPAANQYADFKGVDSERESKFGDRNRRRGDRRDRPPRREGAFDRSRRPGGERTDSGGLGRRDWSGDNRRRESLPAPPPLPDVSVALVPEEKGVEALARQIRLTGRAYPLFEIGYLILKKPERYNVCLSVVKKVDGQVAQPLFLCSLDESLWLSDREAVDYVLRKHFDTFYRAERIPTEPPKGVFTFVAQCGMSGIVLGPPNFHDYQNKLRKLHAERFTHLPFEVYKSRVKIVRDEAVVKQWKEDQSYTTEYLCLNVPEPLKLPSREAVEKHFRETHLANVVQSIESYTLNGLTCRNQPANVVQNLVRRETEEQRRFPLKVVTALSQQFAGLGLQFFKVNKSVTHVCVARPHFLDLEKTSVSETVKRIIHFINSNPNTTRKRLLEALAPASAAALVEIPAPAPVASPEPKAEGAVDAPPATAPAAPPENPEMTALASDLHWLIHEGHVIEFASGALETAKQPFPKPIRPPRPEKAPKPEDKAESTVTETAPATPASKNAPLPVVVPASIGEPAPAESAEPATTIESSNASENPEAMPQDLASETKATPPVSGSENTLTPPA